MTTDPVKPDLVEWLYYRSEASATFWPREVYPVLARWKAQHPAGKPGPLIRCTLVDADWLCLEGWHWPTAAEHFADPPTEADIPVGFV